MNRFLCLAECDQDERFRHGVWYWHEYALPRKGGVLELQYSVMIGGGRLGSLVEAYWFDVGDIGNTQGEEYWEAELKGTSMLPNDVAAACMVRLGVYEGIRTTYEEIY